MLNLLLLSLTAAEEADEPKSRRYSRAEFQEMSLDNLARITGLDVPEDDDPDTVSRYREAAWKSWQQDWQNKHEWGTARQGKNGPHR
ncbi:MAG TPA: hypothetical protein VK092_08590 [Deinococcales bacterium]|nr:hypothetical protein [Deinococcales bacterium]